MTFPLVGTQEQLRAAKTDLPIWEVAKRGVDGQGGRTDWIIGRCANADEER